MTTSNTTIQSFVNSIKGHRRFQSFILFLSILGPGIITANVDNDAGGIATYSLAGSHFGYSLLWSLIPITLALIVIQEMCARMAVATNKGLADLIRENYGVKITFYLMLILLFVNVLNVMAEFAGVAASMQMFGVSKFISVPLSALFVWFLVVRGTYKVVEKVFLVACLFYVSYLISGFMAKPDWGEVFGQMILPEAHFNLDYSVMLMGLIGTTIAPWMQFYLQSSVVEKGVARRVLRRKIISTCGWMLSSAALSRPLSRSLLLLPALPPCTRPASPSRQPRTRPPRWLR
jgi:NRAMP (natural resistance-associated macrophage protein)-like metal ion transporter